MSDEQHRRIRSDKLLRPAAAENGRQRAAAEENVWTVIKHEQRRERTSAENENPDAAGTAAADGSFVEFECAKCARKFPTKRFLTMHLMPDKKKCPSCCKRFRHISNRVNHERVHTGEKPYECTVCGKSFAQVGNLRTHVRIHSGDMPYECDVCRKQFTQMGNLTVHKSTHSADKPYACEHCTLSFCQHYQLVRHQKKKHFTRTVVTTTTTTTATTSG